MKTIQLALLAGLSMAGLTAKAQSFYTEQYRPQIHFSPKEHWMNDPNGMVYYKGVYHLFFQYYPLATTWGPMHWGHATSSDMVHWSEQPIALYPDSLGYIFSGSAVVDSANTSGFGKAGQIPLVAIFTHSDSKGAAAGKKDFQNQSLAYSLDAGKSWIKYTGNPVLRNPGTPDFRDPHVMWYDQGKRWIMTLATGDRVTFYSSFNLKDWKKESDFGADWGAHGGVWECPDLFTLYDTAGKKVWVLLVSINPGGPNGGSATQYFTGDFDGQTFRADGHQTKWLDYGPDDYAGVTWSNTGSRRLFLGWMSNWQYANQVPTDRWRSANTLPRQLTLRKVSGSLLVASQPVNELATLVIHTMKRSALRDPVFLLPDGRGASYKLTMTASSAASFSLFFHNSNGEKVIFGFDKATNRYFIDRSHSGKTDFANNFVRTCIAPRLATGDSLSLSVYLDAASLEVFADGGLTVMTSLVFPSRPYNRVQLHTEKGAVIKRFSWSVLKGFRG